MASLQAWENICTLLQHPEFIGHQVGFNDLTALHGEWIKEIVFGTEDYTLQAHRNGYKSSCLAVGLSLYMILFPRRNTIFLRKTEPDVSEMMTMISKILKSEIMRDICRIVHEVDLEIVDESLGHITTNLWTSPMGAPQLIGIGLKSSITGKHSWLVVTDDICNITDRISRAERERTKLQYDELQNIRNRGGRIINLGTPWHKEDVFSKMPNIHRYDCYTTGLITSEKLAELRASMSPSLFAANYELQHIASEEALFTTSPIFVTDKELLRNGISHLDAAYGGSDNTAFTCGCYREGYIYLFGKLWHKHVSNVLDACVAYADYFKCWPLYCEDNGDKGFVFKELRTRSRYSKGYHEDQNKYIKISSYLKKWWPRIRFMEGTDQEYINQIMDYTEDAEHDDAPDSASCICRIYNKKSWVSIKPEDPPAPSPSIITPARL